MKIDYIRDIIFIENGGELLEQAKKRDHKIVITDIAVDKVPYVNIPGLSNSVCELIQSEHKEILRISKTENDSNEILTIMTADGLSKVRIFGNEYKVDPSNNPEAVGLFYRAGKRTLMYLHNHPSTNSFSFADLGEFIRYGSVALMSVVTNQGEVYLVYKTERYEFEYLRDLMTEINFKRKSGIFDYEGAVQEFLKKCHKGGVVYVKGN